jgi:hypothetical protein
MNMTLSQMARELNQRELLQIGGTRYFRARVSHGALQFRTHDGDWVDIPKGTQVRDYQGNLVLTVAW